MSKAAKVVAGVVVAVSAAWVGTAWYTGTRAEHEIRTAIDRANTDIAAALPEAQVTIKLESFERSIFSSDARYSVAFIVPARTDKANPKAPARPAELRTVYLTDHLEHGPLPWSNLKRGSLRPVMAASTFALEHNEIVDLWFNAANDQVPLHGIAVLGYGGGVDGQFVLAPLDYKEGAHTLAFSGLTLDVTGGLRGKSPTTVKGTIDNLQFTSDADGQSLTLYATGVHLDSSVDQNYIGESVMTVKLAGVDSAERKIRVHDYNQRVDLKQSGDKVAGSILYEVGQVQLDERDIASGQFRLNAANLDATALQELTEQYRQAIVRAQAAGHPDEPELTDEQQQAFLNTLGKLLASNPTLSIDPLVVRTGQGESTFNLSMDLAKPQAPEMSMEALVAETVRKLDARLTLSRPMVTDLITLQYLESGVEPARAATQAQQDVAALADMAVQMGLGHAEGDNIVTTLNYADGQIDFNGTKMPVEEFAGQMFGLAIGGMGGGLDIPMDEDEVYEEDDDNLRGEEAPTLKQ